MKTESFARCDSPDIAIVGMACRYPGNVSSPKQFLQFLLEGGNGIIDIPPERWDIHSYYDPDKTKPNRMYVKRGGFVNQIDQFDPLFFGISPKEAPHIDPQHRWLLEITQEALENAGIKPSTVRGSNTAVYIGQFMHDYEQLLLDSNAHKNMTSHTATGPSMTLTANRISYLFDLIGPSVTLDTACSSSLVALDLACKAILNGDSDMAIAGGVNILLRPELTMSICAASMLSPDGYCKSFDESANGYVRSEGAGLVIVKPLRDAMEQGDPVLAVIKASAVNQDGQTLGITVPNGESQKKLLAKSFQKAGISPKDIQYAEAHGTGTAVGDPIEVNALGSLLKDREGEPCVIGSVKSNVGHMESAAGMAGLMKTVLAINEGTIPGNLHLKRVNPAIDLQQLRLRIAERAMPWPDTKGKPRRALVNSFGFGGTNSNVIIEQAPAVEVKARTQAPVVNNGRKLLPISAKSEKALADMADSYIAFFREVAERNSGSPDDLLHDICYTASLRRDHYKHRLVAAAATVSEFIDSLTSWREGKILPNVWSGVEQTNASDKICFVFSGMGTQWAGVGRELYDSEPVFKQALDLCDKALAPLTGWSLVNNIFNSGDKDSIHSTHIAQPVIFATQVALAELLQSWGIFPDFVVGHSAGEVAASYIAGALSFDDAIQVIYHRSRLQHTTEGMGKMLAVGLPVSELPAYLSGKEDKVSIGAINSEDAITLSGDAAVLEEIANKLDESGIFARFLKVNVPYHSPVMDQLKPALLDCLQNIRPQKPRIRLFSTVSASETREGDWSAEYWFHNVREPVNFKGAIENIADCGAGTFIEIAPHAALVSSIKSTLASRESQPAIIPTLRREQDAVNNLCETIALLHINNVLSPWDALYPEKGKVEALPNYAWQRSSYWCEAEEVRQARLKNTGFLGAFEAARFPLLGGKLGSGHWLWQHQLDLNEFPYLRDHKVGNDIVYPGAAYVEMGLSIASSRSTLDEESGHSGCLVLENINFHQALYLNDSNLRVIESSFDPTSEEFSINAPDSSGTEWIKHASGKIADKKKPAPEKPLDLSAILNSMPDRRHREEFYGHCRTLGLEYENTFKGIDFIYVNNDKALAEINLSQQVLDEQKDYFLHPVILDLAFQTFFATVDLGYLPAGIDAICYYRKPHGKCYSYYETLEASATRVLGNITLCDEEGNILVEVFGIEVLAIQRKQAGDASSKILTYDFEWMEQPLDEVKAGDNGLWILLADGDELWRAVKAELEIKKQKVCVVQFGEACKKYSDNHYMIRAGSIEDMEQVFREHAGLSKGVVFLHDSGPGTENISAEALGAVCENNAVSAVNFTRALAGVEFQLSQKVFLVSRGTQMVLPESDSTHLPGAGLWGFGRVLANEHPELKISLVDLPADGDSQSIPLLVSEVLSDSDEEEIAYRGTGRFIHRLERLGNQRFKHYTHKPYRFATGKAFRVLQDNPGGNWDFQLLESREPKDNEVFFQSAYSAILPRSNDSGNSKDLACNVVVGCVAKTGALANRFKEEDIAIYFSTELPRSHYYVDENHLIPLPGHPGSANTALYVAPHLLVTNLFEQRLNLRPGSTMLLHQADSPFGYAALGIARKLGIQVVVTVANEEALARFTSMGYPNTIRCNDYAYMREIKKAMPAGGFDAVVGSWHGEMPGEAESLVGDFGHLVTFASNNNRSASQTSTAKRGSYSQHIISVGSFLDAIVRRIYGGFKPNLDDLDCDLLAAMEPRCVSAEEYARQYSQAAEHNEWLTLDYSVTPSVGVEGLSEAYIESNRSYLVTGGLGGLGLQIMDWLAENGAKSIVLIGRREPNEEALKKIEQVRSFDISVNVMQADVTHCADVEKVIARIQSSLPPLGGIIHSAGVLDDGVIVQQTEEKIRKVLAPKIKGAWNLHLATRHLSLDLFVCFSSIASVIGWAGQSNYAYANAFMDALAFYRRTRGLPALTINWGPWADAGMAANLDDRDRQRMKQAGMFPLSTNQGLAGMADLLTHRVVQAGVFDIDWSLIGRQYPQPEKKTLLKHLIKIKSDTKQQDFLHSFLKASSDVRESMLVKNVSKTLAAVLGLDSAEAIDVDGNIFDYGVNSLMAMELKNGIQNLVKQTLPTSLIMKNPSVRKIVAYLLQLDFSNTETGQQGAGDEVFIGEVPLTAEQKNFLSWVKIHPQWMITNHYFETNTPYDIEKLSQAVNHVCSQHDSLRARLYQTDNGWIQRLVVHQEYQAVVELDWRAIKNKKELLSKLKDYAEQNSQAHKLESDPLVKVTIVHFGDESKMVVLFTLHHSALDGYSIHILTEDVLSAYRQLMEGKSINLPPQTTPVRDWVAALSCLASSDEFRQEIVYWKSLSLDSACSVPVDHPGNLNRRVMRTHVRYESELRGELSGKVMRTLPKTRNIKSFDVLLSAFLVTMSEWKDYSTVAFGSVDNGRGFLSNNEEIDLSRTIGWLSMQNVIYLNRPEKCSSIQLVTEVSNQVENLPNGGANLELLTAYHEDATVQTEMRSLPRPKIWINYAGNPLRNDKLGVRELEGYSWINPDNQTPWYLLISVNEVNGVVHIYWDYSAAIYDHKTILQLATRFDQVLREIVSSIDASLSSAPTMVDVKSVGEASN